MNPSRLLLMPVLCGLGITVLPAVTTTIDFSGTQYADNFTETANAANMTVNNGVLETTTSTGSLSGITVYNTAVTTLNTDDFSLKIDAKFDVMPSSLGGTSVGFLTNITGGTGYLAVFRLNTSGGVSSADFRIFEGAKTDGTSVGTQVGATMTLNAAALNSVTFNSTTYYTLRLDVDATAGASISFTGSILDSSNSSIIGTFTSVSDSTPTFGGTSVALRIGTGGNNVTSSVDNFSITTAAIPEPSTYAIFGSLGALGLAALRRPRR